ncbi:MAG: toprim domain-containing protein, partial [Stellaceae bacterium]
EGYMDVIALQRAGYITAVAPLGTALTEFQLHELWRLAPEPILCFDGDAAGQRAALRVLHRSLPLLRPGYSLRFATLPPGEDPDSILRAAGAVAFDPILAAARPLADILWESEVRGTRRDTPERLAGIRSRLLEHVRGISDPTVRSEFETLFRKRCDPWEARRKSLHTFPTTAVRHGPPPPPRPGGRVQRENLFRILLTVPSLIDETAETLASLDVPEPELDALRCQILEVVASQPGLDARTLRQHLVQNGLAATVDGLLVPSVDTIFLVRCFDPTSTRKEWARATGMLTEGGNNFLAEATNDLISDISSDNWERFLAAREQALRADPVGEDET